MKYGRSLYMEAPRKLDWLLIWVLSEVNSAYNEVQGTFAYFVKSGVKTTTLSVWTLENKYITSL